MILKRTTLMASSILTSIGFIHIAFPPITPSTLCLSLVYGIIHGCISCSLVLD
jgi:hypothetical protein